jgi:SAM-dependent methyltransferase
MAEAVREPLESAAHEVDELYREFYEFVSRNQDIDRRLRSFADRRSYHYKDLHYVRRMPGLTDARNVLDLGCCGTPYPRLFDLDRVSYTGVDIAQHSLDRMREIYPDSRIRWVLDDICELASIPDGSVDLAIATQVFEHLPDPARALEAMLRVLKPGGFAAIGTEASLYIERPAARLGRWLLKLPFYLGSAWAIHGQTPAFAPLKQYHAFADSRGVSRRVEVVHGRFHPRYFEELIAERRLPARIVFTRVTGDIDPDILFMLAGASLQFRWLELKARLPLLRHLGSQIFVAIQRDR